MPEIYEGNTGVYCIRNVRNGKRYVGSSAQGFRARRWEHWRKLRESRHENRHLQKSWNRYGPGSFVFQIIERCPREKCLEREQYWMDYFDATNRDRGYNISPVAGSNLGVKRSKQTITNYAEKAKRQWADPEIRRRMQEALKQNATNPEWLRKTTERNRRNGSDPEWRRKHMESRVRLKENPKWWENIKKAGARRSADPEWRQKVADGIKRRMEDPEWWYKNALAAARRCGKSLSVEDLRELKKDSIRRCECRKAEMETRSSPRG